MAEIQYSKLLKLKDVYNKDIADIFVLVISIIGFVGVLLSVFTFFIILFKSTPSMKKFKFYLLWYTASTASAEIFILLYKPIYFSSFAIIYPRGLLSPMDATTSKLFLLGILVSGFGIMVFLLIMLIERYFAMSIASSSNRFSWLKNPNFYIYCWYLLFIVACIIAVFFVFIFDSFYDPKITQNIILSNTVNGIELLTFQPSLVQFNNIVFRYLGPVIICAIVLYFTCLLAFYSLCFYSYRKYYSKFSSSTRETNKMLFRSLNFQMLMMIFCVMFPMISIVITSYLDSFSEYVYYMSIAVLWSAPIVDTIIIIFSIRPYRYFVLENIIPFKNLFKYIFIKNAKAIQPVQSTGIEPSNQMFRMKQIKTEIG